MKVENRNRMRKIALLLGAITLLIIVLAIYRVLIAKP